MKFEKIAILTSPESWFIPYSKQFIAELSENNLEALLFSRHEDIDPKFEVVFILSYFRIIKNDFLIKRKHNIVVHESNLPKGKGWAPLFWQILEGKNEIPIVLFEASDKVDNGDIYLKDTIILDPGDLHDAIREKQAGKTIALCKKFLFEYDNLKPEKQSGNELFYRKRQPLDSKIDINKSIKEQFNLLRICDNENYPAFFDYCNTRYKIILSKIEK